MYQLNLFKTDFFVVFTLFVAVRDYRVTIACFHTVKMSNYFILKSFLFFNLRM